MCEYTYSVVAQIFFVFVVQPDIWGASSPVMNMLRLVVAQQYSHYMVNSNATSLDISPSADEAFIAESSRVISLAATLPH